MMKKEDSELVNKLSVRQLVAGARQSGSLTNPSYDPSRGIDGIRAHKKFINLLSDQQREIELFTEYTLNSSYVHKYLSKQYRLEISGRCDVWYLDRTDLYLIEIKSYRGPKNSENDLVNPLHWAQAETYAHILLQELKEKHHLNEIHVCLAYVAIDSNEHKLIERVMDADTLQNNFSALCQSWLIHTLSLIDYRQTRDKVNTVSNFPYENLRAGQHFFMRQVIAAIRDREVLFAQAATGSGKTMATIYPALKAQAANLGSVIFYLTNMSSTKLIAEQAIEDLRQAGFLIRSLTLTAKEKICLEPDLYCEMKLCPYAKGYYDRLPPAIQELAELRQVDYATIHSIAKKHLLCPFELQLDYSEWCDVVIGDYNYFFDPRVYLNRFFAEDNKSKHIILIDEAHNLPGRSRQMYSAFIKLSSFRRAAQLLTATEIIDLGPTKLVVNRLRQIIDSLNHLLPVLSDCQVEWQDSTLLGTAIEPRNLLRAKHFIGTRKVLLNFHNNIGSLIYVLGQFLDVFSEWEHRDLLLDLWFDLLFYQRVAESFYDKNYITMIRQTAEDDLIIGQLCLDASVNITAKYYKRYPLIFFSATLSPMRYYQRLLYNAQDSEEPDSLQLPSPFAPQNRLVLAVDHYSVRYQDRGATIRPILELIFRTSALKSGHYLVFCPSFNYLRQVESTLKQITVPADWRIMVQKPQFNEQDKRRWLKYFQDTSGQPLLGFACMGSIFNEGIDLSGEQLIGVFIIGTGLPHPSPERELMRQYYEQEFGSGFHYAYTFPGFNRVTQAAGRLIRGETDRGIIVLLDDRYARQDYQQIMPTDWLTKYLHDDDEVISYVTEFWDQF